MLSKLSNKSVLDPFFDLNGKCGNVACTVKQLLLPDILYLNFGKKSAI